MATKSGDYEDAPRIDVDAAMFLVDEYVLSGEGSQSPCTRAEVAAAFSYLTSVTVGATTRIDESKQSIVITAKPFSPAHPKAIRNLEPLP